jgi:hypothetical protein
MTKSKRGKKAKKVSYELIDRHSEVGGPIYSLLEELVVAHHEDLLDARIALAWCMSWRPDVDGRQTLGKCMKATDLHRELAPFDFVILLNREFYTHARVTAHHRRALLDHELNHAARQHDAKGEPLVDERGRPVYRLRKHDLEEFAVIAERYGCWKGDLVVFAQALERAHARTPGYWVGAERLHGLLQKVGATIPQEEITAWSQEERFEAEQWALLRIDFGKGETPATQMTVPAKVAAALATPALPFEPVRPVASAPTPEPEPVTH